ncbi:MAG: PAS domain-containing protein [Pseudomonadota bacterium]
MHSIFTYLLGIASLALLLTLYAARRAGAAALVAADATFEQRVSERTAQLCADNAQLRQEIDSRRDSEQAAARSEDQLQEILAMMPVALFLKDPQSRIVMMNEACEQIFGVTFAQLSGTRGSAHYPPEQMDGFLAADRATFAARQLRVEEEWIWHAGLQENRRLQTFKKPLFDAHGQPSLLVGMCIDVTERMRAEEALAHSLRQLRELSDHQETVREEERRRIAQRIHDELGQNLMALKIDATLLHARTRAAHALLHERSARALETLDETIRGVRGTINELHPSTLELGLPAAVEWLLKQIARRGGVHCQLHLIDDSAQAALQPRATWAIFRIIQEALATCVEHAHPSRLDVSLDLRDEALLIVISDDGTAPQEEQGGRDHAFGMLAMRERVAAFGGGLALDSQPGRGTTLTIMLPGPGTMASKTAPHAACSA